MYVDIVISNIFHLNKHFFFFFFFFFFFLSIGCYCGAGVFGLIGCISLSPSLALLTFFNNNNKSNDSTLSTYVPGDNVLDSAELINSELKCLDRWLKSNKIIINADKTKYMPFSYNKNVNFTDISVGKNTINETSVTKFLGIHIDKKFNFVNHITEMSMKVAKSIGLLYKLKRFLPETILKTLNTSLIHPYSSYGIEA